MITYSWLEPDIFAVHLAHYIRRYTKATSREESIRLFSEDKGVSMDHVMRVIEHKDEPSAELLEAVNAQEQITQKKRYRFRR